MKQILTARQINLRERTNEKSGPASPGRPLERFELDLICESEIVSGKIGI
jgi:hypothetical protein